MGNTGTRPYIIDEFESEDDTSFEPVLDYRADPLVLNQVSAVNERNCHISTKQQQTQGPVVDRQIQEVHASSSNTSNSIQGLDELLKLLENHDFDGAQKAASLLKKSTAFCHFDSSEQEKSLLASVTPSVKSADSSTVTSTWSTNTEEDITEVASGSILLHTEPDEDLTEDQKNVLVMLDEELSQFEANEEKIANEPQVFHSGIPRLISARSSSGSRGSLADVSRQTPDRKRSPSPSGRLKSSGIPRYSWAHVSPVTGSPSSPGESKLEHRLDASSLSDTLESLPELTDRIQTNRRLWDKTFVMDKTGTSTGRSQSSLTSGQSVDTQALDINISDHTGRARVKKKHFCLPPSWTEEFQKTQSKGRCNIVNSNTSTSQMGTAEILACKTIGECGDPSKRKVLDLKRWYCISRPQYRSSCGISAIVSCWNYLFSTMGHGRLKPVTQEAAMKMFGFTSPFDEISFGPITGNVTLLRWFGELCSHFNVSGQGFILYKPSGTNQTDGMTDEMALDFLKKGLKETTTTFIYHCHNHYICPIGYEDTPQFCVDAYGGDVGNSSECWVLFGDTSRKYPSVHCVSWDQICQDLNCKYPSYINIRQIWKGVQQQKNLKTCACSENLHCILAFQTVSDDTQSASNSQSSSSNDSVTKSPPQPTSPPQVEVPTANAHSKANAHRPELGDDFKTGYQEEEVGVVKLDSFKSDDKHVDESEISVNGVENSVKECEISVNGSEISVNGSEISVNMGEISVNGGDSLANGGEISVNGDDSLVNGGDSLANGGEISVNGGDSLANGGEISVNGSDSLANGGEISVNGSDSLANGMEISVNGSDISVTGSDISVTGSDISVTGSDISTNGGEISVNGGDMSVNRDEISVNGSQISIKTVESSLEEGESSVNEDKRVKEAENSVKTGESSVDWGENSGEESENSVKEIVWSVKECESSVKVGESSVKEDESSIKQDERSVKEDESSLKDDESSAMGGERVEEGESSVKEDERSVKVGGSSVKEGESSINEDESSIKEGESSINEDESSIKEGESSINEDESSVKEDESSVKEGESSVKEVESSVKEDKSSVNDNESSDKESESSVNEEESSVKEGESSVKEDESSLKDDESSAIGGERVEEGESWVKEGESSIQEGESSVKEGDKSVKEDESSLKEGDKSVKEDESSVHESESLVQDSEMYVHEGESSVNEGEKSEEESESAVKEDESSGEESENSVKEVESSGEDSESSVKEVESSIGEVESSVREDKSSVKDGERVEESDSSVQEGETSQCDQVS